MIKFNVNLADELHRRFKLVCVQEGKDMSEVVRKCIDDYVEKAEKKLIKIAAVCLRPVQDCGSFPQRVDCEAIMVQLIPKS